MHTLPDDEASRLKLLKLPKHPCLAASHSQDCASERTNLFFSQDSSESARATDEPFFLLYSRSFSYARSCGQQFPVHAQSLSALKRRRSAQQRAFVSSTSLHPREPSHSSSNSSPIPKISHTQESKAPNGPSVGPESLHWFKLRRLY